MDGSEHELEPNDPDGGRTSGEGSAADSQPTGPGSTSAPATVANGVAAANADAADEPRIEAPEARSNSEGRDASGDLIIGLVGAVGTNLPKVEGVLLEHLSRLGFDAHAVSLSGLMGREYADQLPSREEVPYDEYVFQHMTAGNVLRSHWKSPDALAFIAVEEIRRRRDARDVAERRPLAIVLRSLKRKEEIRLLRQIYRGQFVVIGCHAPREMRIRQLSDQIARSRGAGAGTAHRARAEALADRDEHELGPLTEDPQARVWLEEYGQSVEDAFPLADAYINLQDGMKASTELRRFCDLLLGAPFISPSKDEHAMFHAGSAAVRSADMSRQVGAAIAKDGRIIAVGCNEVPRPGGGAYWEGDNDDARDFQLGMDANQDQRERAVREVFDVLSARGLLTEAALQAGPVDFAQSLDDTRVDGLIEFTRSAHAEMLALLDAAQRGVAVDQAVLYTSTFPCHNCAKHIIAAGISRVVFIEPYPKSLAEQLHGDAIAVDDPKRIGPTVHFQHFAGVAPMNYFTLFKNTGKRKNSNGTPKVFSPEAINPKLRGSFHATPLRYEEQAIASLDTLREKFNSPSAAMLADAPTASTSSLAPVHASDSSNRDADSKATQAN